MLKFSLKFEDLIERELPIDLIVIECKHPFNIGFIPIIESCIDIFNREIQWNNMFSLDVAFDRINNGEKFFIAYHEGELFGYCWLSSENKIYNVFSKKTYHQRKYGATDMLYYIIKNHTTGVITAEVDEWNYRSINVFNKLGFTTL